MRVTVRHFLMCAMLLVPHVAQADISPYMADLDSYGNAKLKGVAYEHGPGTTKYLSYPASLTILPMEVGKSNGFAAKFMDSGNTIIDVSKSALIIKKTSSTVSRLFIKTCKGSPVYAIDISKENERFISNGEVSSSNFKMMSSYYRGGVGEIGHVFNGGAEKTYIIEVHNSVPDKVIIVASSYDPTESTARSVASLIMKSVFGNNISTLNDIMKQLSALAGEDEASAILARAKKNASKTCQNDSESSARKVACDNAIDALVVPELLKLSTDYWCGNK